MLYEVITGHQGPLFGVEHRVQLSASPADEQGDELPEKEQVAFDPVIQDFSYNFV